MPHLSENLLTRARYAIKQQTDRLVKWSERDDGRNAARISEQAGELTDIADLIENLNDLLHNLGTDAENEGFVKGFSLAKRIYDVDYATPALEIAINALKKKTA